MKAIINVCLFLLLTNSYIFANPFNYGNFFFPSGGTKHDTGIGSKSVKKDGVPKSMNIEHILGNQESTTSLHETPTSNSSEVTDVSYRNSSEEMVTTVASTVTELSSNDSKEIITSTLASATEVKKKLDVYLTNETEALLNQSSVIEYFSTVSSGEVEGVVHGTVSDNDITPDQETFFQKSLDWVEDAYTLSILLPVGAGILFATTIIITIACCRSIRRCCRRRRVLKKKPLPETIRNLRPSDQARLLSESSDDEF